MLPVPFPSGSPPLHNFGLPTRIPIPLSPDQLNLSWQLYLLLNSRLPQKELKEEIQEKPASPPVAAAVSSFSIDNLLERKSPEVTPDRPTSTKQEAIKEEVHVYTLDALDVTDGRSKERMRSSRRITCDECGKSYATPSNLSRHKQTHRSLDSEHAKKCPHCDRVYVSMPALSMHLLTHNAQHSCEVCGKTFSRLWLLQGHLRSHSGTRPFGCAHCGKFFSDRSNLRAHILTHTGEKRYACDACGRRFVLRSYLNRHVETACKARRSSTSCKSSSSEAEMDAQMDAQMNALMEDEMEAQMDSDPEAKEQL